MISSLPYAITHQGRPAVLSICRNDGYCWGRVSLNGAEFDVIDLKVRDRYDWDDGRAAAHFAKLAQDPSNLEPARGWL